MKKTKLAMAAGSFAVLLGACAADTGSEQDRTDLDIDTIEQGFGEAACGTFTSSDPSDGKSLSFLFTCGTKISPDGNYSNALTDVCKRGYYREVQNITAASTISVTAGYGDTYPDVSVCTQHHYRATVYATDTNGVTVNMGSLNRDAEIVDVVQPLCIFPNTSLSFARVQPGHTFVKARVVAQAYRDTSTARTYKKVFTSVDDAASPCP